MNRYILGYADDEEDFLLENLIEFLSPDDADYNSSEWCWVEAETLNDAKHKYEETFNKLKTDGKIIGPF